MKRIPDEELKAAMMEDFHQFMVQSTTPDREYSIPIDNVRALIDDYWPKPETTKP